MKFLKLFILISALALVQLKEKKVQSMKVEIQSVAATSTLKSHNSPKVAHTSMKKKTSFAQTTNTDYKQMCQQRDDCEACALEWDCEFGAVNAEAIQECYQYCLKTTVSADLHEDVLNSEGTK